MKVLISGGVKTDNITNAMAKHFQASVDIASLQYITEIKDYLDRGDTFDRLIVMQQSITHNGDIEDPNQIASILEDFVDIVVNNLEEQEIIFIATNEDLAEIIYGITFNINNRAKIILYQDSAPFKTSFFKSCVTVDINNMDESIQLRGLEYKPKDLVYETAESDEFKPVESSDEIKGMDVPESFDNEQSDSDFGTDDFNSDSSDFGGDNELGGLFGDLSDVDDDSNNKIDDNFDSGLNSDTSDFEADFDGFEANESTDDFDLDSFGAGEDNTSNKDETSIDDVQDFGTEDDNASNSDADSDNFGAGLFGAEDESSDKFNADTDSNSDSELDFGTNNDVSDEHDFGTDMPDNNSNETDFGMSDASNDISGISNSSDEHDFGIEADSDDFGSDISELNIDEPANLDDFAFDGDTDNSNNVNDFGFGDEKSETTNISSNDLFNESDDADEEPTRSNENTNNDLDSADLMSDDASEDNSNDINEINNNNVSEVQTQVVNNVPPKKKRFSLFGGRKDKGVVARPDSEVARPTLNAARPNGNVARTVNNVAPNRVDEDRARIAELLRAFKSRGNTIVCSGTRDSGTSTMVANLANVIAKNGYTVLVVDLDYNGRTQSFINRTTFDAIHEADPNMNGIRYALNNKSGDIIGFTMPVREGYNVLTTGLGVDLETIDDIVRDLRNIQDFLYTAKGQYDFVIFDCPFDKLIREFKGIVLNVDNIVLDLEPDSKDLFEFMMMLCNIEDIKVRELIFSRAGIIFNKYVKHKYVLGKKNPTPVQMLKAIDDIVLSLTGYSQEFYKMHIINTIPCDERFEDCMYGTKFISDYPEGMALYLNVLRSILENY